MGKSIALAADRRTFLTKVLSTTFGFSLPHYERLQLSAKDQS